MVGSFPGAATFWSTYSAAKGVLLPVVPEHLAFLAHAGAAAAADVAVCAVRNPFEVVKQQMQAGLHATTGEFSAGANASRREAGPPVSIRDLAFTTRLPRLQATRCAPFCVWTGCAASMRATDPPVRLSTRKRSKFKSPLLRALPLLPRRSPCTSPMTPHRCAVAREIPFDAIEFALYEGMKRRLSAHRRRELVLWENAVLGARGRCGGEAATARRYQWALCRANGNQ
jgi:hypothetical protein